MSRDAARAERRRRWVALLTAGMAWFCGVAWAVPGAAAPAAWPQQPIKLIVPFPPGGAADAIGRYYARRLGDVLGQPVLVDNKPGAGTAIAAEAAARATPDGYTLSLATTGQLAVLPHLQPSLRFDALKDFTPVALLGSVANVVAVSPQLGVSTLPQLLERARSAPGKTTYSSCGGGTLCHLTGELLQRLTGVQLLHVPYKGSAPAVVAAVAGEVDVAVDTLTVLAPQIRAGKLRGLVLTSAQRSPLIPDVPSAADAGVPGFTVSGWFGLVAPAGTPEPVVARLAREIDAIARSPDTTQHFTQLGIVAERSTPASFGDTIRADHTRWAQVVRDAGVRPD